MRTAPPKRQFFVCKSAVLWSACCHAAVVETGVYLKPSHSGVHLSYESCLPWSCKRAVATNQFSRAIRNSPTPEAEDRSMSIIEELLERNDYPRTEINAAWRAAKGKRQDTHPSQQQQRDSKGRHNQFKSVIKLPFINDSLAARVSRRVRKFSPHVRVVFVSAHSLKDMLVRSSSAVRVCPREKQRSVVKRGRGRPMECRACDASMVDSQCLVKGVVYCLSCTLCAELYVGETARPVRGRFAEHYREARAMVAKAPWGFHYRTQHRESLKSSNFLPFHQAKILGREASLPSMKLLEAIEIRKRKPAVNCDDGWRLIDWLDVTGSSLESTPISSNYHWTLPPDTAHTHTLHIHRCHIHSSPLAFPHLKVFLYVLWWSN